MDSRSHLIRRLAIASLAGQAIFIALVILAGLTEPGYSEVVSAISELGARTASHAWIFNSAVAIWGVAFLFGALSLALDGPRDLRNLLGPGLICFTAVAQMAAGFPFPADCRTTMDSGCKALGDAGLLSWRDAAHGWSYFLGAIAILGSVFAIAWRIKADPRWERGYRLAIGSGIFGLVIFGGLFYTTDYGPGGHYGVVQRLALAAGALWVASITIAQLAIHGREGDPVVRLVSWLKEKVFGPLFPIPRSGPR